MSDSDKIGGGPDDLLREIIQTLRDSDEPEAKSAIAWAQIALSDEHPSSKAQTIDILIDEGARLKSITGFLRQLEEML